MSLFDKLKDTKFKSLKFGSDRPGTGTGPEPIIQTPINDNNKVGIEKTTKDTAVENRERISRLLTVTPRGINFVNKQQGLQSSNTRLELSNAPILSTVNIQGSGFINTLNSGINLINSANALYNSTSIAKSNRSTQLTKYNAGNTLSQIEGDIGDHFDRFGLTPYIEDRLKYINIAIANNSEKENRLTKLYSKLKVGTLSDEKSSIDILKNKIKNTIKGIASFTNTLATVSNTFGGSPFLNKLNNKVNNITKIASPFLDPMIDQYIGGPGSKFGVGATNIRRFDFTNNNEKVGYLRDLTKNKLTLDEKGRAKKIGTAAITNLLVNDDFLNPASSMFTPLVVNTKTAGELVSNRLSEFDKVKAKIKSTSYDGFNIAIDKTQTEYSYKTTSIGPIDIEKFGFGKDLVNYTNFITNPSGRLDDAYDRNDGEIMTVVFQLLDPFSAVNLHRILFPAYMNGFKVSSDATWNPISYIGRSEDLYVYTKFKRQVSFNLQIPCFNPVELRERHRALGALESSLAGKYNNNKLGGIMTRLYVGNYLRGEVGIVNSLSYDIPNESSWDIDEQLAHNINLSINFTVIHQNLPTYEKDGGFFKNNIKNGANYFISSEKALNKTGANDDPFLKTVTNGRFASVTRVNNNKNPNIKNETKKPEDTFDEYFKNDKGEQDFKGKQAPK